MSSIGPRSVRILVVAEDVAVRALASRVLERRGDEVILAHSLAEGVERGVDLSPDVAFVDVAEHQRMGLTLVHALRASLPRVAVYALTTRHSVDAGAQALSLGAEGVVLVPPTGDELLLAVDKSRERLATEDAFLSLRAEAERLRLAAAEATRLAGLTGLSFAGVARALVASVIGATSSTRTVVYAKEEGGGHKLLASSEGAGFPHRCDDDSDLADVAARANALFVPLLKGQVTLLAASPAPSPKDPGVQLLSTIAGTLLSDVKDREALSDGAMKDPATSAYSFGYFVDVAGREIDKARLYGRRFALVSISLDAGTPLSTLEVAERTLRVARDIDVLARVDESELLLLMPEADGLEVNDLRQRLVNELAKAPGSTPPRGGPVRTPQGVTVGTSTFPHDGEDLTQLLRVARRRAEATRVSIVERLKLEGMTLPDVVDALLWDGDIAHGRGPRSPESPRAIELPIAEVVSLVSAATDYALRGGATLATVTQRDELGLSAGVRMKNGGSAFEVRLHDIRHVPGGSAIEAFAVVAEHASYALVGRLDNGIFRGVHAADPMLGSLVAALLEEAASPRRES